MCGGGLSLSVVCSISLISPLSSPSPPPSPDFGGGEHELLLKKEKQGNVQRAHIGPKEGCITYKREGAG